MGDGSIFIAIIRFSRDYRPPKPRQFIIINNNNNSLDFLETESVPGKRKFTPKYISEAKKKYHILTNEESIQNGFDVRTAINCCEIFNCDYFSEIDLLKNRDISVDQLNKIKAKVESVIAEGLNEPIVNIEVSELKLLNRKLNKIK